MDSVKSFYQSGSLPAPSFFKSDIRLSEVLCDAKISFQSQSGSEGQHTHEETGPRLSSDQLRVLEYCFAKNRKPGTNAKVQLAEQLNLSRTRVTVCHINFYYFNH